jgi:hypothetical protein
MLKDARLGVPTSHEALGVSLFALVPDRYLIVDELGRYAGKISLSSEWAAAHMKTQVELSLFRSQNTLTTVHSGRMVGAER